MKQEPFSNRLSHWLKEKRPKTLGSIEDVFGEKTFAIALLLLLFIPALPLPTGGISHVTELIGMLLALEIIIGRRTIWLPKSLSKRTLSDGTLHKAIPFMEKRIRWFEKFSRPRLTGLLNNKLFRSILGVFIFAFCLGAFLAPPFSGLDTLPALGVVVLSLGLILEDVVLLAIGIVIGCAGLAINIGLGSVIVNLFH